MATPPVVALEIGTTKTLALVGELREHGNVLITGIGRSPSSGVRKGEIVDMQNAVVDVRSALQEAEERSRVAIRRIHLAVSGGHIGTVINRGSVPVPGKVITAEDVEDVRAVAGAVNLPSDREPLHTICQSFCVDAQENVLKPEGMEGVRLSVDVLIVHGVRNTLRNVARVVRELRMEVQDAAFSGICSALAVLTPEQKKAGVIAIDMGGGTTEYVVYAGTVLAAAGALGVGGDHVTNDIALAFSLPQVQAERLKRESGSAVVDTAAASKRISLPAEVGFPGRTVPLRSLQMVIGARTEETFGKIRERLDERRLLQQVAAGVVLSGGGAHLRGACQVAEKVFGVPCIVGRPRGVSGLATATEGPEYATAVGMVQYAFRTQAARRHGGGLFGWLRRR
jgi:cell division protein FtsA